MFTVYGGKCLSSKAFHNWVEKYSQGRSKVADDTRPGRPVKIATEAAVQRVEKFIRTDRRITIDSEATALRSSHCIAYSIMHDRSKFRKVCAWWVPRELKDRKKVNRIGPSVLATFLTVCKLRRRYAHQDYCWGRIMGASLPTLVKAWFNALETSEITFILQARSVRLRHQLGKLCLRCSGIQKRGDAYCEVLLKLRAAVRRKHPGQLARGLIMPDSIQPKHLRREFKNYSGNFLNIRLEGPDLVPSDFHLSGQLKTTLVWQTFRWWRRS
jgi:hypothetical protein